MILQNLPVVRMNSNSIVQEVRQACSTTGFFILTDHGIDPKLLEKVFAVGRLFFALDLEAKSAIGSHLSPQFRGYSELGAETLNFEQGVDHKECFDMGEDVAKPDARNILQGPNQWPDLEEFRPIMEQYFSTMHDLSCRLLTIMAQSLELEDGFFTQHMQHPGSILRLIHYPPSAKSGCGVHTDYGLITILAQDSTGGLQVKSRNGTWIPTEPLPGSFVVNIGDLMQRWTNGTYVSTPHRVICTGEKKRFSVPFFVDPNYFTEVQSDLLPPILAGEYLQQRLRETYQRDEG